MLSWVKIKEWIGANVPMMARIYENKYLGMLYDRFASLPTKQQKQLLFGSLFGGTGLVFLYFIVSYLSLWSDGKSIRDSSSMVNLLMQYQKNQQEKGSEIKNLDRNARLAEAGQLKDHLLTQGRASNISMRSMQIEEKPDHEESDTKAVHDLKMKQATVVLERVNLNQLTGFLNSVEFGAYNLSISSLKLINDEKIRGYMRVELGIVAYIFNAPEGGPL